LQEKQMAQDTIEYNFKNHRKGDTFNGVQFTVTVNSVAFDITDAEIKMSLRNKRGYNIVKAFSVGSGITIIDGAAGIFKLNAQIIDIEAADYLYDIQIKTADGVVKTYITGTWKIIQDIT